jgi:hypothetical protein
MSSTNRSLDAFPIMPRHTGRDEGSAILVVIARAKEWAVHHGWELNVLGSSE